METTPDISFFFAVHDHLRADLDRYVTAVSSSVAADRGDRLPALDRWAKGFTHELEEHHYVEDAFFFPHLRQKVPTVAPVLDRLESSLALLRGDLERAANRAHAVGDALWRVRRFAAPSTRAALLAMIHAERGSVDDALSQLEVIAATPYGASISWLTAWVLAEAGRESEAATALASFGDRPFLQRHAGELAPLSNRFVCAGNGGIVLGPVAYALALAQNELGETDAARRHAEQALSMSVTMSAARCTPRIERLLSAI